LLCTASAAVRIAGGPARAADDPLPTGDASPLENDASPPTALETLFAIDASLPLHDARLPIIDATPRANDASFFVLDGLISAIDDTLRRIDASFGAIDATLRDINASLIVIDDRRLALDDLLTNRNERVSTDASHVIKYARRVCICARRGRSPSPQFSVLAFRL
jgi:hypothetical protein